MTRNPMETLGEVVASEHDAVRQPEHYLSQIRERLASATTPAQTSATNRLRRAMRYGLAAALVLSLGAVVAHVSLRAPDTLVGVIEGTGEPVSVGQWLSTHQGATVRFSEGTRVKFEEATRGRWLSLERREAHLLVESGKVDVDVIPVKAASWRITTGPFQVHVKGTEFTVRWAPEQDAFELELRRGSVVVSGCVFGEGRRIEPGDTVRASCKVGKLEVGRTVKPTQVLVEPARAAPSAEPATSAGAATARTSSAEPPARSAALVEDSRPNVTLRTRAPARDRSASAPARETPSWHSLIREGKLGDAFLAADAAGFEHVCRTANAAALSSLGDGARYRGAISKASYAYETLRERFPGTSRAAVAAFSLARIEFDQRKNYDDAARWFRLYLREQPGGHLAREAEGRLLEALHRSGDRAGARAAAKAYLKTYADGPHRAQARAIVGAPAADDP